MSSHPIVSFEVDPELLGLREEKLLTPPKTISSSSQTEKNLKVNKAIQTDAHSTDTFECNDTSRSDDGITSSKFKGAAYDSISEDKLQMEMDAIFKYCKINIENKAIIAAKLRHSDWLRKGQSIEEAIDDYFKDDIDIYQKAHALRLHLEHEKTKFIEKWKPPLHFPSFPQEEFDYYGSKSQQPSDYLHDMNFQSATNKPINIDDERQDWIVSKKRGRPFKLPTRE